MRIQKIITLLLLACLPLCGMAQDNVTRKKKQPQKERTTPKPKPKPIAKPTPKPKPKPTPKSKTKSTSKQESKPVPKPEPEHKQSMRRFTEPEAESKYAPQSSGSISGHEYVDLGLPSGLKWATCNVGASSPSDYGNYYAWGETSTKSEYTDSNSQTYGKTMGDIGGSPSYDAARANWGGSWRLPTKSEFEELLNRCTWTWTNQGGHNGYLVKGPNGRSIFLPAAGWRNGASLSRAGEYGSYWSSTPYESGSNGAYDLTFDSGDRYTGWYYRYLGHPVRAVSE